MKWLIFGHFMMLSALPAPARADASSPIVKGPYLQALTSTSVEVRVEVDPPRAVSVEISGEGGIDAGIAQIVSDSTTSAFHVLNVTLLRPAQHYAYAVRVGDARASGTFTTAPRDDSNASFSFIAYGDNRTDPRAHAVVANAIAKAPSDFLVHTGDFVQSGSDLREWQTFFDIEHALLRDRALFSAVGNHELVDRTGVAYLHYFAPEGARGGDAPALYGTSRWANTRFFFLNGTDAFERGDERAWLESALNAADDEAGIVWRIVVLHHGPYSSGQHGNNIRLRDAHIPELLEKHHVDLVLSGHDHIYERGYAGNLRYVVTGGGGAPLYRDIVPLPSSRKAEATYHYVTFDVSPERVSLVTTRTDGSILERCGFTKAAAWDCDAPSVTPSLKGDVPPPSVVPAAPGDAKSASASKCGCRVPGSRAREDTPLAHVLGLAFMIVASRRRAWVRS